MKILAKLGRFVWKHLHWFIVGLLYLLALLAFSMGLSGV